MIEYKGHDLNIVPGLNFDAGGNILNIKSYSCDYYVCNKCKTILYKQHGRNDFIFSAGNKYTEFVFKKYSCNELVLREIIE
jgi:hypothetical protein